jgi:hypothetical protein
VRWSVLQESLDSKRLVATWLKPTFYTARDDATEVAPLPRIIPETRSSKKHSSWNEDHARNVNPSQTSGKLPVIVHDSSLICSYLAQAQGTPCKSATVALL